MVHLSALPGAPRYEGSIDAIIERAIADARILAGTGFDGIIIENFGDAPFQPTRVPAITISAMTRVALEVRANIPLPLGVNVLRNDARAALAIAAVTDAAFIRVNVHTGAMLTDQGWIRGNAHGTMRRRRDLGIRCAVFADVAVKHAVVPPGLDIAAAARDTWHRGLADALIVSGPATGSPPDLTRLETIRGAVPEAPIWIGSGIDPSNAAALASRADGVIVGSAIKVAGRTVSAIDPVRAARLMEVFHRLA
jgi:uncharacterized protein